MRVIDVKHLGRERVIGCWEVDGVLIDPGPTSALQTLIEALDDAPRAVLLTHIHLDHAGGTGTLLKRWPELQVYVHERGAPHLADPSKLIDSASRLYGDEMERLWGDIAPVPSANLHPLAGGEEVLGFRVAYTPGHASHHVSFLHEGSGHAFVGDTAAVRIPPHDFVVPPTPPPDIDVELWEASLDEISSWSPRALCLTHFGQVDDPGAHIETVRRRLHEQAERAKRMDGDRFAAALRADVESELGAEAGQAMSQAVPSEQQWAGLDRYWRRRAERSDA